MLLLPVFGKTISSKRLAAACCNPGATWLYVSSVICIEEWPSLSCTILGCIPCFNISSSSIPSNIFESFKDRLGEIPKNIAERLKNYPEDDISAAVDETLKRHEQPHWGYVEGVLKNWREHGQGRGNIKKRSRQQVKDRPAPAHILEGLEDDRDKYIKQAYGHIVKR